MSATFNISGAPIELLDIPQLLALHNMMYKFDPFILDTFFPKAFEWTEFFHPSF